MPQPTERLSGTYFFLLKWQQELLLAQYLVWAALSQNPSSADSASSCLMRIESIMTKLREPLSLPACIDLYPPRIITSECVWSIGHVAVQQPGSSGSSVCIQSICTN